jgi:hypothetical protein
MASNSGHTNLLAVVLGNIKMQQFVGATMKACKKCGFIFNKSAKHVSNIDAHDDFLCNEYCTYMELILQKGQKVLN